MGYRYGEHRYSEGLYSRWPDWWHDKACVNDAWDGQDCPPPGWAPSTPVKPPWTPVAAAGAWAPIAKPTPPWTPAAAASFRPGPSPAPRKPEPFKPAVPHE